MSVCACLCVVCKCGICSCVCASVYACVNTCRGYRKTLFHDLLAYCLQTESPFEPGNRLSVSKPCWYFSVYPCHTTQGYRYMGSHTWIFISMLGCQLKHSRLHSQCTCLFSHLASPRFSLYSKTPSTRHLDPEVSTFLGNILCTVSINVSNILHMILLSIF